jgi:hypothetical protein
LEPDVIERTRFFTQDDEGDENPCRNANKIFPGHSFSLACISACIYRGNIRAIQENLTDLKSTRQKPCNPLRGKRKGAKRLEAAPGFEPGYDGFANPFGIFGRPVGDGA